MIPAPSLDPAFNTAIRLWGTWRAQVEEWATPELGVVSSSPTWCVEITKKEREREKAWNLVLKRVFDCLFQIVCGLKKLILKYVNYLPQIIQLISDGLGLSLISSISKSSELSGTKWFATADIKQEDQESNFYIWNEWRFNTLIIQKNDFYWMII